MPDLIKKQYIAKSEIDEDERTVTAVISTDIVDRDKEVLLPKGANFEPYLQNPVVQWAHNYNEPSIAKTLWLTKGRKKIKAKVEFTNTVFADEIYQLYKNGFLNAFSVGFIPKKSHQPTPEEIKKRPEWAEAKLIFDEWELLEFSAVPVPANPEALTIAVKTKEISVSKELQEQLGIEEDETFYTANSKIDKYKCECIVCGHKLTTEKHCNEIKCPKCGGEMRREERPGPGRDIDDTELKPYPNEHSCRLKPPNYDRYARKKCEQKHDGKCIDVIYGIKEGKSEIQALRYPKDIWSATSARSHCKSREGSFEPAKAEENTIETDVFIKTDPRIKTEPKEDIPEEIIKEVCKKLKGIMY